VVAFAWASNAVGTVVDARRVCRLAHDAGPLAWIDAVQYAAHEPIDVSDVGADVLICSPYKFCGPHLGLAYGRAR
jgi:selenocysteine lyase/cysteine desulfurase